MEEEVEEIRLEVRLAANQTSRQNLVVPVACRCLGSEL